MRPLALLLTMLVLPAGAAVPQQETGFLNRTVSQDEAEYPYQVYLPRDYASRTDWPVILFLHGAGERGDDGLGQAEVGLGSAIRRAPALYPAVVVMPQAPAGGWWPGAPAAAAIAALDATLAELSTDADRVYLTGLSMGGNGSWYVAYQHAEKFAAVVPICGWVSGRGAAPDWVDASSADEALAKVAERLRRMPMWVFHGEVDEVVPVDGSRLIVAALREAGSDVTYTELPGTGHNAWDPAYRSPALAEWLFAQRRR